jgi:nucleoid-associated protein YgaU
MSNVHIPVATSSTLPTPGNIEVPKMYIYNQFGKAVFIAPYAPRSLDYSDMATGFSEVDRAIGKPYAVQNKGKLKKISFTLNIHRLHHQDSIEDLLDVLTSIMNDNKPVFLAYGPRERRNWWHPNNMAINVSMRNVHNEISRADVPVDFIERNDPPLIVPFTAANLGIQVPNKYQTKAGDTLTGIALRFYGDTEIIKKIAQINGIRTNTFLPVGTVLKLPKGV